MLDLAELEQFVTYAQCGTLSATAEVLHLSQSTLTRTMRHIEEGFDAELFNRGKNRIELTVTGKLAVEQAQHLLAEAKNAVQKVQDFERSLHTINVLSCAPAPLWSLLPELARRFPGKTISSKLIGIEEIIADIIQKKADIGILPFVYAKDELVCSPYLSEQLFVCVPETNTLAQEQAVSFAQINGFNCLLRDHIGFWSEMVKQKMPASRFLVQSDEFEFNELVHTSTLLCFTTNVSAPVQQKWEGRRAIPLTDKEADVTYQLVVRKDRQRLNEKIIKVLKE